jgi:hypothetical protein
MKATENALLRANLEEIIRDHGEFRDFVDRNARHIRELIIAHGKRLQVLEVQEAIKGIDTDPHIIIEIQEIRTRLEKLYKQARETTVKTDFLIRQIMGEIT